MTIYIMATLNSIASDLYWLIYCKWCRDCPVTTRQCCVNEYVQRYRSTNQALQNVPENGAPVEGEKKKKKKKKVKEETESSTDTATIEKKKKKKKKIKTESDAAEVWFNLYDWTFRTFLVKTLNLTFYFIME